MDSDAVLQQACAIVCNKILEKLRDMDSVAGAIVLLVIDKGQEMGVIGISNGIDQDEMKDALEVALEQVKAGDVVEHKKTNPKPKPKTKATKKPNKTKKTKEFREE